MVVAPDKAVRMTLAQPLRQAGHEVVEAPSAEEAWTVMKTRAPAVLLADMALPDVNGPELLRRMRDWPSLDGVPAVAFGRPLTPPHMVAAAFDAGASGYFVTPVSEPELLARVRATLLRRDLTARLRASEERFQAFMDNSPAVAFIKDRDGRFLYTNAIWRRQFHPEVTDWSGRTEYDFWPREVADAFVASDRECLRRLEPIQLEETGYSLDGSERTWLVFKYPVPMHDDIAVGGMAWDITDRQRAERAVKEYATLLDTAQHIGRMGSWTADAVTGEVRLSDSTCVLFGIRPEEFGGTVDHFLNFVIPEDRPGVLDTWMRVDEHSIDPDEVTECEYRIRQPGGEIRWMFERGHVEFDARGRPTRRLGMVADITERKRAELQTLRDQRMDSLGTLAGGIAHDLNNVLAPILMSIDLLRESTTDVDSQKTLDVLEASAQRGARLIRQVLSFARGVDGQRAPVDLGVVVHEVESIGRDTFLRNVRFTAASAPALWPVLGDATQIHQVLLNLIVNARDAVPDGGSIAVDVRNETIDDAAAALDPAIRTGSFVVVSVADTGRGIPDTIRERVFEPFFTTKAVGKGTGLGLSTTLAIVRSHGGFIGLASEEGRGTRVTVYLPAARQSHVPAGASLGAPTAPRGSGELVMVVDDETSIRRVAASVLERFGYRVVVAADGAGALALFRERLHDIAVVLTDIAMPGMDGVELIRVFREAAPDLPIVASSGLAGAAVDRPNLPEDVAFVAKPYTADALLHAVRSAIDVRSPT